MTEKQKRMLLENLKIGYFIRKASAVMVGVFNLGFTLLKGVMFLSILCYTKNKKVAFNMGDKSIKKKETKKKKETVDSTGSTTKQTKKKKTYE